MKRRDSRVAAFRLLFAYEFNRDEDPSSIIESSKEELVEIEEFETHSFIVDEYAVKLYEGVLNHTPELDGLIEKCLKNWRLERISIAAKLLLRLGTYEIYYEGVKPAIVINEIIEISKNYEDDSVSAFINGVLGSIVKMKEEG